MLVVETIAKIRRAYFVQKKAIKEICRELNISRKVVRRVLRSGATEFVYERKVQPQPKIGPWRDELDRLLATNAARASRERLTLIRLFEELRGLGYAFATTAATFVPLSFAPGEAYQFDWSHEVVLIAGRHGDGEGRAGPALPQPDDVRPGLSARDAGDGVRCPRPSLRPVQGRMPARHLRQHEDGGGDDPRRQGASLVAKLRRRVTWSGLKRLA
jgi:hypothetical protein